jgi:hypothetical protein
MLMMMMADRPMTVDGPMMVAARPIMMAARPMAVDGPMMAVRPFDISLPHKKSAHHCSVVGCKINQQI